MSYESSTSLSLLRRVKARDPSAWERLADLYGPLVFPWGRKCGLGDEDIADVMQEVFASVWRGVDDFSRDASRGTFRGWLWTITRNKIRDFHRKRAGRPRAAGGSAARLALAGVAEPLSEDTAEPTDAGEATRLFHRALELVRSEFTERTWQAFWRNVVEEHDTAHIAADLGITAGAVRQAKSRVLRRLRQELGDLP